MTPHRRPRPSSPRPPRGQLPTSHDTWRPAGRSATTRITEGKGEGDHVGISPERDTPPRGTARGPQPGDATSWRDTPRSAVTWQVLGQVLLGAALLVCLGLLLGATWTAQALQARFRRHAEERRRLNEEWAAVRTTRGHEEDCPHCGYPLTEQDWYVEPTLVEYPPDDD